MMFITQPSAAAADSSRSTLPNRSTIAFCVALACAALSACGGGGDEAVVDASMSSADSITAATHSDDEVPGDKGDSLRATGGSESISATSCSTLPTIPTPPSNAKQVTSYGATPDDTTDDTVAIQAALDSLADGEWLVFPAGKYLHNKAIRSRKANVKIYGSGATLHATNSKSMAFIMSGQGSALYSFKLTAVTTTRMASVEHARIAVFNDDYGTGARLVAKDITIQGNQVTYAGDPGTELANSSSSAGILVSYADNFLIAQNTVARTLSDGIHMTGGSTNGRVLNNTVRETGDDMIAVVSILQGGTQALNKAKDALTRISTGEGLNKNIFISGNNVSGNYWGRGISVVGGKGVTIRGNTVSSVPGVAGILAARDKVFGTYGSSNVIIENNVVEKIQNTTPVYNPGNKFSGSISGQGAIEMFGFMYSDEAADTTVRDAVSIKNILVRNNTIKNSGVGGVRGGPPGTGTISAVDPATGKTVSRGYEAGMVKYIGVQTNVMSAMTYGINFYDEGTALTTVQCTGNTLDDKSTTDSETCTAATPPVSGASLSTCSIS